MGAHRCVSSLTGKKVKAINNNALCDHLLYCNHLFYFENLGILAYGDKKVLFEIKETFQVIREKPSLNKNINSAPLYLFDKVS